MRPGFGHGGRIALEFHNLRSWESSEVWPLKVGPTAMYSSSSVPD